MAKPGSPAGDGLATPRHPARHAAPPPVQVLTEPGTRLLNPLLLSPHVPPAHLWSPLCSNLPEAARWLAYCWAAAHSSARNSSSCTPWRALGRSVHPPAKYPSPQQVVPLQRVLLELGHPPSNPRTGQGGPRHRTWGLPQGGHLHLHQHNQHLHNGHLHQPLP